MERSQRVSTQMKEKKNTLRASTLNQMMITCQFSLGLVIIKEQLTPTCTETREKGLTLLLDTLISIEK
jgi:hypothetical protein